MSDQTAPPVHVLIVEDEPMIARILEHKLTREGHRLTVAATARLGGEALRIGDVDVALIDVSLEIDGIDFAEEWREAAHRGIALLIEAGDTGAQERAAVAGLRVISKPFKPTAVAALVAAMARDQ